jgi:hypothetical protein
MAGKTRRANIDKVAFIRAYVEASKNGGTNESVGKQFDMDAQATSLKASQLRKELAKKGRVLPYLEGAKRTIDNPAFDEVLASLDAVPAEKSDESAE